MSTARKKMVNRLDQLEHLYLNILRVTIIVLATLLLAVAAVGLLNAVPKLLPSFGMTDARKLVQQDHLKDYRAETAAPAVASGSTSAEAGSSSQAQRIDGRLVTASKTFVAWAARGGAQLNLSQVEIALDARQKQLAENLQGDYADSLVQFSKEVLASGKSGDDLEALIAWHYGRFEAAQAAAKAQDEARAEQTLLQRQQALVMAGAAGSAFLAFLSMMVLFVLVKIERNLRLVRVEGANVSPVA